MKIKVFQGGYDKNLSYLIWCEETKHSALIDASTEINPIIEYVEKHNFILSKILITHTHHDHIIYLNDYLHYFPNINIYCFHKPINIKEKFIGLINNESIIIGNNLLTAIYTPGHFVDSMCFWNKEDEIVFTGDTLFVGRTGRTISTHSNIHELYSSVYNKLLTLPKNTIIYPGHHYGHVPSISIKENILLSNFFTCKNFEKFNAVMKNYEKSRL